MRFRLNLDAPFNAHSLAPRQSTASEAPPLFEKAAHERSGDQYLRRPTVPQRARGEDFSGEKMARYIGGLEARLAMHLHKQAPRWLERETQKVLLRWSAPQLTPSGPSWAPAIDRAAHAREYATALVAQRLRARMHRLGDIRLSRALDGSARIDPLHRTFEQRAMLHPRNRQ